MVLGAHPRSRGEHAFFAVSVADLIGSSPLTRGAHQRVKCHRLPLGLIPAHAGSTFLRLRRPRPSWAHPRSRGEHGCAKYEMGGWLGSSPLTRGARSGHDDEARRHGLIPAHAGSTAGSRSSSRRRGAHPRSRGEHSSRSANSEAVAGSSPLTRGAPCEPAPPSAHPGLIPAHAGSTM